MTLLMLASALGADWLTLQSTEPARLHDGGLRPILFAQPVLMGNGPEWQARILRARLGVRGVAPGTNGRLRAAVAVEIGDNGITRFDGTWRPKLLDASLSVGLVGEVNLRVGAMKLPLSDEALEPVHQTHAFATFSRATGRLLMERHVREGAWASPVNAFRDLGVQLNGRHAAGALAASWGIMVSNGSNQIGRSEPGVDISGRAQLAWLPDPEQRGPERDELAIWAFGHTGKRTGFEEAVRRTRWGAGAQWRQYGIRLRTEVLFGDGMLAIDGQPVADGMTWGLTQTASYAPTAWMRFGAEYSYYDAEDAHDVGGFLQFTPWKPLRIDVQGRWHSDAPSAPSLYVMTTVRW